MPLDRYLPDLLTFTLMCKPRVIQIWTYQHQFQIIDIVYMITHDPPGPICIDDQIQFQLFMIVKRETELLFDTGKNSKTVVLGKGCYFPNNISTHMAAK